MNTMTCKGYAARIEYSDEDTCFIGHIAGITDVIGFHANNMPELRAAFLAKLRGARRAYAETSLAILDFLDDRDTKALTEYQAAIADLRALLARRAQARAELEQLLAAAPTDPRAARAWVALGRARAATNDPPGAREAYARGVAEGATLGPDARLGYARLLVDDRRFAEARQLLEPLLRGDDATLVARAAYGIGDAWQTEGDQLAAAEYFMTAAYVAPTSPAGRRALLAAAWSFMALKQPDAAATVYRKLLAQADVPADLAEAARKGLRDLGR